MLGSDVQALPELVDAASHGWAYDKTGAVPQAGRRLPAASCQISVIFPADIH
jgi:hypothetical protein